MIRLGLAGAAMLTTLLCAGFSATDAAAQAVNDRPQTEDWWPGEWGPDDRVGAPNRTTPDMVLDAVGLVTQGKVATLGKLYASDIPLFGPRVWSMTIPGAPTAGPLGENAVLFNDEMVTTQLGQVGTQFDGPGHVGVRTPNGNLFYGGRNLEDVLKRHPTRYILGVGELGVEAVAEKGFVCRGVLLNAAAHAGLDRLPIPDSEDSPGIVSAEDVEAMVEAAGIDPIGEGDCVFLHTGHGDLWKTSEWPTLSAEEKAERVAEFNSGEPGFGLSACQYLADRKVILTGSDQSTGEASPVNETPGQAIPCHLELQPRHGIWNLENLEFTQLIEDGVSEFLFVWSPLKIVGATGSPANPVALY